MNMLRSFTYTYLLSECPETPAHHEFKWHLIKSKNLDFSDFYPQELIKDLYLPEKSPWVLSESQQVLIYVCPHTCLYLLSPIVSNTLETAIYLQSLLDTLLLLPDIQRHLGLC